jgi:hypothetical protein
MGLRQLNALEAEFALNRDDPGAMDERFLGLKPASEAAVTVHSAL